MPPFSKSKRNSLNAVLVKQQRRMAIKMGFEPEERVIPKTGKKKISKIEKYRQNQTVSQIGDVIRVLQSSRPNVSESKNASEIPQIGKTGNDVRVASGKNVKPIIVLEIRTAEKMSLEVTDGNGIRVRKHRNLLMSENSSKVPKTEKVCDEATVNLAPKSPKGEAMRRGKPAKEKPAVGIRASQRLQTKTRPIVTIDQKILQRKIAI